jgi:hypothetical protein
MLESFTLETFSGRIGEAFRVRPDASVSLDFELISATGLGDRSGGRPFSIVFRGPNDVPLPQRIYSMEHPHIGAFDLFLVPIGPDGKGMRYEAVFN